MVAEFRWASSVRISLRREPVQRVVQVGDGLALAVGLAGQVVVGVVLVVLAEGRREIGLRHAAKVVIGESRLVAVRVGDADMQFSMNKSKSKAPPVTLRDRWAARKFKTISKAMPPAGVSGHGDVSRSICCRYLWCDDEGNHRTLQGSHSRENIFLSCGRFGGNLA